MFPSDLGWFQPDVILNSTIKIMNNKPRSLEQFRNEYSELFNFSLIMISVPIAFTLLLLIGHVITFIVRRATRIEFCKFRRIKNILLCVITVVGLFVGITSAVFLYHDGQATEKSVHALTANISNLIEKFQKSITFYNDTLCDNQSSMYDNLAWKLFRFADNHYSDYVQVLDFLQLDDKVFNLTDPKVIKNLKEECKECASYAEDKDSFTLKDRFVLCVGETFYNKSLKSDFVASKEYFGFLSASQKENFKNFKNDLISNATATLNNVSSFYEDTWQSSEQVKEKWSKIENLIENVVKYLQVFCISVLTVTVVFYAVSIVPGAISSSRRRWLGIMLYSLTVPFVLYLIVLVLSCTIFPIVSSGLVDLDRSVFVTTANGDSGIFTFFYNYSVQKMKFPTLLFPFFDLEAQIKQAYESCLKSELEQLPDYSPELLLNVTKSLDDNWAKVFGMEDEFLVDFKAFLESRPLVEIYTKFTFMTIESLTLVVCCVVVTMIILWLGRLIRRSYYVGLETSLKKHSGLMEEYIIATSSNRRSMYFPPSPIEETSDEVEISEIIDGESCKESPTLCGLQSLDENCGLSNLDECDIATVLVMEDDLEENACNEKVNDVNEVNEVNDEIVNDMKVNDTKLHSPVKDNSSSSKDQDEEPKVISSDTE